MSTRKNPGLSAISSRMTPLDAALAASRAAVHPTTATGAIPTSDSDSKAAAPVPISVRLPKAMHEDLRRIAFEKRVSIHSLILEGVEKVVAEKG